MKRYPHMFFASLATQVLATCECGYSVNGTNAEYFGLFTNALENDFLHFHDTGDPTGFWKPQVYDVNASYAHGEYGKSFQLGNVIANPMPDGNWNGNAIRVGDPGLQLWVRSELEDGLVPSAEFSTGPYSMLYGSYRAGIKMTSINGTCGAFFWYRNDTREVDIEYLSKEENMINLINQEPSSDGSATMDKGAYMSAYELAEGYHDYRFDWMPDRIDFYIDSELVSRKTGDIPRDPGHLMLSHWSNGNTGWSAGPPKIDAVMTVSYVKAYYNTTSRDFALPGCTDLDAPGAVCTIKDQTIRPDPAMNQGKTPFLTVQTIDTQSASPSSSGKPMNSLSAAGMVKIPSLPFMPWAVGSLLGFVLFTAYVGSAIA